VADHRPELQPYQVLGVSPHASRAEIANGYKVLAQIFHPDRFADSPQAVRDEAEYRMRTLNEAYARARKGYLTGRPPSRNDPAPSPPTAAGVPWDVASRDRAERAARANEARRAKDRSAANGTAMPRPRPRGPAPPVLAGLGLARYTGNITCRRCSSVQWLPEGWQEQLDSTAYHCSMCDQVLLAR
jgi:hypothetical protein